MNLLYVAAGCSSLLLVVHYVRRRKMKLPPGPPGLPLIGNILDISPRSPWLLYHNWCQKYNTPLVHASVAGSHIIVLDRYDVALDLLDRRSAIYSSRPHVPFAGDMVGWKEIFPLMPYGSEWRAQRKLFNESFSPQAVKNFRGFQHRAVNRFLQSLLDNPAKFSHSIRKLNASTLLSIAYGSSEEEYITLAERAAQSLSDALVPGAFLVDFIPAMKWIPAWAPGGSFHKTAKAWYKIREQAREIPFQKAKAELTASCMASFAGRHLQDLDQNDPQYLEKERRIQSIATAMYIAGTDVMTTFLLDFFIAMVRYPHFCQDVRKELDPIIQEGRLPDFDDTDSGRLPRVTAFVMEVFRYFLVAPLGLPHVSEQDDEYMGYYIPKGTLVFANMWAMLHDENEYPHPFTFNPNRFLTAEGNINAKIRNPISIVYGFGRRVCPGKYLAIAGITLTIARTLACFDVGYSKDKDGNVLPVEEKYTDESTVITPTPFQCSITPRSQDIRDLILTLEDL